MSECFLSNWSVTLRTIIIILLLNAFAYNLYYSAVTFDKGLAPSHFQLMRICFHSSCCRHSNSTSLPDCHALNWRFLNFKLRPFQRLFLNQERLLQWNIASRCIQAVEEETPSSSTRSTSSTELETWRCWGPKWRMPSNASMWLDWARCATTNCTAQRVPSM